MAPSHKGILDHVQIKTFFKKQCCVYEDKTSFSCGYGLIFRVLILQLWANYILINAALVTIL